MTANQQCKIPLQTFQVFLEVLNTYNYYTSQDITGNEHLPVAGTVHIYIV